MKAHHSDDSPEIFEARIPLPDDNIHSRAATLLGFEPRYVRISHHLRLLTNLGCLEDWSVKQHGRRLQLCDYLADSYPLILFHGDVGTGKTATAEGLANRLVTESGNSDCELFKLSTNVRGEGKVGQMGTLINAAFDVVLKAAGQRRRACLIIDEGDSLAAQRSQEHSHHEDKVAVNTLIQRIDSLKPLGGRVLVVLCTNRLNMVDPAIVRRAAIIEHFTRPSDEERLQLLKMDLSDLNFKSGDLQELARAIGPNSLKAGSVGVGWTYSDIRTRLYPYALALAYPNHPLDIQHLMKAAGELSPSPAMED